MSCRVALNALTLTHSDILSLLATRFLPLNPSNIFIPLFHCRRIAFCLDVHNEAVKCMRYPPDAYKKELALGDKDRKDEKSIEELIKELEDEYEE
jgi:Proteasome regulatory subunit C-terminal